MKDSPGGGTTGRVRQNTDLVRLAYISLAPRDLTEAELGDIEARSGANNFPDGITGLLIAHGRFFYGIMEGPRRRLMKRMEVIITDPRHRDLRILLEEEIDVRRFANWSFARLPDVPSHRLGTAMPSRFILEFSRRLA